MITTLVVTSDVAFGDLLRTMLQLEGRFSVCVTAKKDIAVGYVRETSCSLALLDTGISEEKVLEIGAALRHANPLIRYIIISEAGWHSSLEELSPVDYLPKPFQPSELVDMMNNLFGKEPPKTEPVPESPADEHLPWLSDVTRAAQLLTRLMFETSAQAALITRREQLWAFAGGLPQNAPHELAEAVSHYWDRQKENDLVRFIHLNATSAEHMLYATRLAEDMVLALIFDVETPFSTIRSQASQLVHSLSTLPPEQPADADFATEAEEDEAPLASISDILNDVPSPNPLPGESLPLSGTWVGPSPVVPQAFGRSLRYSRETSPVVPLNRLNPAAEPASPEAAMEDLEKTIESAAIHRKTNWFRRNEPSIGPEETETKPASSAENARKIRLEPISPAVYNLDYACLLIPRIPSHYLTGDLMDSVSDWVPQICIAFNWRLEYISVRPEYLLWIANVAPSTSPAYLMRIMRLHTSERIFNDFPRLKRENPSGDFWAAGYLIMGGSQPPQGHLIKNFITQTRQGQGFTH